MHSTGVAIACLLVTAASVSGMAPSSTWSLVLLAVSVAVIGVPHGGLDHWTGRRLLGDRFPRSWAFIFFPTYLAIALMVMLGWNLFPLVTAVGFFLTSAWHFGLEDDRGEYKSTLTRNLVAAALGGMVIWIPVLMQPTEVGALLASILPSGLGASASAIVVSTGWIAIILVTIALLVIVRDICSADGRHRALRNAAFALMFATAPVLISFGLYFCGWHSIRGLKRLADENDTTLPRVLFSAMPLSIGAILLAAAGFWFWSAGQTLNDVMTRTLFVSLSAIAVPHLLLHGPISEIAAHRSQRMAFQQVGVTP